jgi:hypothetical protein
VRKKRNNKDNPATHFQTCIYITNESFTFQAIEDLTKALEFEPNSPDILHERGYLLLHS